jgi:hypothetical protein
MIRKFFLTLSIAAGAAMYAAVTPAMVQRLVESAGSRAAVERLSASEAEWRQVIRGIESGSTEWLKAAIALAPGLDAHPGEDVGFALGVALRRHPTRVLRLLPATFPVETICGGPDVDEYRHLAPVLDELRARQRAVRSVNSRGLNARRDRCLAELAHAERSIRAFFVRP